VREIQLLGGDRMAQEANAGRRKATGTRVVMAAPSAVDSYNWPDTGGRRDPSWVLTWAR